MRNSDSRRARLVHLFALDRNELRRRSDRIEAWFLLALAITYVPLAAVLTISAAHWVQSAGTRQLAAESELTRVTAIVVRDTPVEGTIAPGLSFELVPARWTAGGVPHTGAVPAAPGTKAMTPVRIWIDAAGNFQQPPLTPVQLAARVVLASVAAPLALALAMLMAWCGLRWPLDRRRLAAWGESWSMVGPSWTR